MAEVITNRIARVTFVTLFYSTDLRMRFFGVVLAVVLCGTCFAQNSTHDSIYASMRGKISLGGGLDSRNSFISNRRAHIWGIKLAAELGELIQLGIGYNRLDDEFTRTIYFTNENSLADSAQAELRMDYFSWYARYVFYRKGRWKFSVIPFQLGIGRSRYMHMRGEEKVYTDKRMIIVYETGFSISFRICRWLGVGSDVGVRWMVKDNPVIPDKFNSPQYAFYAIIYWTEIIRAVAPNNRFVKML